MSVINVDTSDGRYRVAVWKEPFAQGTYASVHSGDITDVATGKCTPVAVKVQRWAHEHFQQEIQLQSRVARASQRAKCAARVLPVYGCCTLFNCPAVVMPLVDGSVFQLLGETPSSLRKGKIINRMVRRVASLLRVLQRQCKFFHRDLHCSNVLYMVEGDPLTAPVSAFRFFLSDFGNAGCYGEEGDEERQDSCMLDGLQRKRKFAPFNPGLDLNTLLTSTRKFLSVSMREIAKPLREAIQYFLAKASRSRAYTCDGQDMLRQSLHTNGKDIGHAACNPMDNKNVPLFWFSYAGASGLPLNKTTPMQLSPQKRYPNRMKSLTSTCANGRMAAAAKTAPLSVFTSSSTARWSPAMRMTAMGRTHAASRQRTAPFF